MNRITFSLKQVIAGIGLSLVASSAATAADNFSIEVDNDDISVQATNANLTELLLELEKLTGIPVKFVSETTERVTVDVGLTNIENAISKITPNHMIVHGKEDGKQVIKELIIIPDTGGSGSSAGSAFLPNGQPAPDVQQQALQPQQNDQQAVQNGGQTDQTPNTQPQPGVQPVPNAGNN